MLEYLLAPRLQQQMVLHGCISFLSMDFHSDHGFLPSPLNANAVSIMVQKILEWLDARG